NLPAAEDFMREAYELSPGNFQAARELASVCLLRGDIESAEQFARVAFNTAPDSAFVLDMMLSVLLKLPPTERDRSRDEIETLFKKLEQVSEEDGRSFYATRRAEYELRNENTSIACSLIDEAVRKTPGLFNVHALRAEIYLEHGN